MLRIVVCHTSCSQLLTYRLEASLHGRGRKAGGRGLGKGMMGGGGWAGGVVGSWGSVERVAA